MKQKKDHEIEALHSCSSGCRSLMLWGIYLYPRTAVTRMVLWCCRFAHLFASSIANMLFRLMFSCWSRRVKLYVIVLWIFVLLLSNHVDDLSHSGTFYKIPIHHAILFSWAYWLILPIWYSNVLILCSHLDLWCCRWQYMDKQTWELSI